MEGLLKKRNAKGVWKDRYGILRNGLFLTYKPKGSKPTSELKESLDLTQTIEVRLVQVSGISAMEFHMNNGEEHLYQGPYMDLWVDAVATRRNWALERDQAVHTVSSPDKIHVEGWLAKKSHNKYQGFQDRYVRVVGVHLRYFKGKSDEKELGSANLETTEFVRPYDSTDDCRIFELLDSERVFIFQCQSHVEMEHWMDVIENVRQGVQSQRLIESHAKLLAETPARVRLFDEEGESRFREEILLDLADLYPPTLTEEEEAEQREMHESGQGEEPIVLTVAEHVACATSVIQYLHEFLPDVAKLENCAPRYDILAVMIMLVNGVLAERLMPLMNNANNEVQRCDLVERANLGDLHALINLVANYQSQLKLISCPSNSLPQHMKNPKHTPLFEVLPKVCELYVYGGSLGTKGGAAAHLYDHCNKVWNEVVKQPEEMLQKHQDGTFYTHAPIDMWEAINQHISLATSTNSPILHVMIADKVVSSLNKVVLDIIDYVQSLKSVIRPELKDIELEFVCALANDTALHIEESIELIENFSMPEIRDRIDDIFDSLTTNLVTCGQACLQRLASLVMHDVRDLLNEVFTPDWLEGNQIHSAVATLSDYMGDFQDFLVSFWADKFVYTILEEVTLTYTRSVVFHKPINGSNKAVSPVPASAPPKRGFFSSFGFNSIKEIITVNDSRSGLCAVDPDSLGRLAQDVNILNAFFSKKAGQEIASEFLEIISEISLMLFQDIDAITIHTISRISLLPSAADAIYATAKACLTMRDDINKEDLDFFCQQLVPALSTASLIAQENEANGIAEGRLGLLFSDLVPKDALTGSGVQRNTLAQKLKNMSNIPSLYGNTKVKRLDEEDADEDAEEADSTPAINAETGKELVHEVLEMLNQQEELDEALIAEAEQERQRIEQERNRIGVLRYEGYLEKKSPSHIGWQRRYFKLLTRETGDAEDPYSYSLLWYKKEGGTVLKALDITKVKRMAVHATSRTLAYSPSDMAVMLESEANSCNSILPPVPVKPLEWKELPVQSIKAGLSSNEQFNYFSIIQSDGKEHHLRSMKLDRILKWINFIAKAGSLAYDSYDSTWNRGAHMFYEEQRAEHSLQSSFTNPRNSAINIYQRSPSISDRKLSVDTPTSDREVVDINSSCSFSPKELLQQSDDYDDYDEEEEAEDNEEADLVDDELEDKEDSLKHENAILNPIAAIRAAELEQEAVKQEERESQKRLVEESEKLAKERKLQLEQERLAQEAALEEGRKKIEDMKREQRELEELEKRMKEQRAAMRQKLAEEESKMKQEAEIQEKIKQDARSTVNEKVMRQTTIEEGRLQAQAQISDTTIAVGETHDELSVPGQDDNSGANISDDSSAGASEDSSSAGASGDERDSESVKNKETENGNGKFDDVDLFKMEEVDEDESLDVLTEQISSPDPKSTIPHIISSSSSLKERNTENLDEKIVYDGIVSDSQDISNTSNEEAITKPSPQRGRRQPGRGRAARAAPPPPTEDRINTDEYEQLQENLDEVGIVDTIPVSKTPGNSEIMPKEVALRGVDLDVNLTADTDRRSSFSRASTDSAGSAPLSSPSKFKGKRKSAIAAVVQRRDNTKSEVPQMDGPCGDERHTSIDSANDSIELDEKLTASEFSDTDVKGKQALSSTISPPELRGNLQKKSPNVMKGWQKRYAILRAPGELVYYSSELDAMHNANDPKGRMSISEMVAGEGGVVYTTGTTEFTVQKREGKNLALKAGSAKDARQWVEAFLAWSSYVNN